MKITPQSSLFGVPGGRDSDWDWGARWLTSEVDKNLLRAAAAEAAGAQPSAAASQQIALAAPAQALNVAKSMM